MASSRYYRDPRWRRVRARVLERDDHRCQIHGPRCTVQATQVDHIIPLSLGGRWLDPTNLRASCANCNRDRVGKGTDGIRLQAKNTPPSRPW